MTPRIESDPSLELSWLVEDLASAEELRAALPEGSRDRALIVETLDRLRSDIAADAARTQIVPPVPSKEDRDGN